MIPLLGSLVLLLLGASTSPEVDAIVEPLRAAHCVPGVGLALVKDGEVLLATGYGVADARSGAPVTDATVFSLASVSKSFTAATVMRLVESGKLSLDAPVATYLPDFAHADAKTITLRQLLSQTSGFPRLPEWPLATREELVKRLATVPLENRPGSSWRYCNQNFILAGHVVERVASTPWEEFLRGSFLEPLGMKDSHASLDRARSESSHAQPHVFDVRSGAPKRIEFESHLAPWGPSGNVHASARDMARWARFEVAASPELEPILTRASQGEIQREQVSLERAPAAAERRQALPVENTGYALGFYTETFRGKKLLAHEGTLDGFTSSVTLVPEARAAVVILTNGDHADLFCHALRLRLVEWLLGLEKASATPSTSASATPSTSSKDVVADIYARAKFEPERQRQRLAAVKTFAAEPSAIAPLVGVYSSIPPGGPTIVVKRSESGLTLEIAKEMTIELVPFEKDGFLANSRPMVGRALKFRGAVDGTMVLFADDKPIAVKTGR